MDLKLHANATTTPKTRAYIQSSDAPVSVLARQLGVSESTIRRWRSRQDVSDRSHKAHNLAISLSPFEEELVCALRREVGLGLDDIVEVMRRCVRPEISRSAIYRCLRRNGISGYPAPDAAAPSQRFEPTAFGFVHIDLKHLPRLKGEPAFVFVAIERTTRFAYIEIVPRRDARTITACLKHFLDSFGHEVHTILTDNVLCREATCGFGQQVSMREFAPAECSWSIQAASTRMEELSAIANIGSADRWPWP